MARFSDIPIEVLQEIIPWAFLGDQANRINAYLPNDDHPRFLAESREDKILSNFSIEEVRGVAVGMQSFSHSQLLNGCFIRRLLDFSDTEGGTQSREWKYGFKELGLWHQSNLQTLLALSITCRILHGLVSPLMWISREVGKGRSSGMANHVGHFVKNDCFANNVLDLKIQNGWRNFSVDVTNIDWGLDKIDMAHEYVAASKTDPLISATHVSEIITQWSPSLQSYTLLSMLPNLRVIRLLDPSHQKLTLLIRLERYTEEIPMPIALQNLREIAIYWGESSECNLHQYS
jgi:hypothetical protein